MDGINRAPRLKASGLEKLGDSIEIFERRNSNINDEEVPCIFISYQREDQDYASEIAKYIMSMQLDVYFDLEDNDLRLSNQTTNAVGVTNAIKKGLNKSSHMIVIISPTTYRSLWVPFEVGYAYDKKGEKMKILRHKEIDKARIPAYLKVKEILNGTISLNRYIDSIRKSNFIYESLIEKGEKVKAFSSYNVNPLNKYLDNE